ncbi:MAG: DNA helicase PcrA [Epulopiscium sp.]|nr:DNA helicase PcrA [Candidatus Epulonipiscium sp.]
MSITTGLNERQKEAVLHTEGPLLILAGAGSGKTRVLTHRIAHLVKDKGVNPWNILAITFTNKAASEMKERIEVLIGQDATESMWVSTFHSMCVRILRRNIHLLGYGQWFTIYDASDQKVLLKDIIKNLNYDEKLFPVGKVLGEISAQKNKAITPEEYKKSVEDDFRLSMIANIYALYQQELKENNALDFDDLLMKTNELFTEHPDVLKFYQNKFQYIHVDEYQDTNTVQYYIVRHLAGDRHNLCVVGDDDQSIYGWRGADIANILDFERDFPGARAIKLEQNYRSTGTILEAANSVVSHNKGRKPKKLWTDNEKGKAIEVLKYDNEYREADFIADNIRRKAMSGDRNFSDFAVLYRTNAQSRVLEEKMVSNSIPYRLLGGTRFYERREIKDLLAYLRVIENIHDDVSIQRIINVPRRRIGAATVDRISQYGYEEDMRFYEVARRSKELEVVGNAAATKVVEFIEMMDRFRTLAPVKGVAKLLEDIIDTTNYYDYIYQQYSEDAEDRISNIGELISKAANYESTAEEASLAGFLEEVTLVADVDNYDEDSNSVVLMTLHSAKGLEFPVVFMPGLEEGLFPSSMSLEEGEDSLEEERRLCYVGITRARQRLYLLHAECRRTYGRVQYAAPSRFLSELPSQFRKQEPKRNIPGHNPFLKTRPKMGKGLIDNIPKTVDQDYNIGDRISHIRFGEGIIEDLEDKGDDLFVTINFDNGQKRRLSAKFARLKVI